MRLFMAFKIDNPCTSKFVEAWKTILVFKTYLNPWCVSIFTSQEKMSCTWKHTLSTLHV